MDQKYYQQGKDKAKENNYQEAIALFTEAIKLNPTVAEYYYQRALAYFSLGNLHQAVFDYNESIKCDPEYYLAYYGRGLVRVALKNLPSALEDVNKVIYLKFNYAPAHKLKGIIARKSGDIPLAIISFKKSAQLFLAQKDKENCRACLDLIEQIKPTPKTLSSPVSTPQTSIKPTPMITSEEFYQKILNLTEKGEISQALAEINWVFQLESPDAQAYICKGLVYQKKGNLQQAISDFNQAIKLNPENEIAYRNRGKVRLQLKDWSGAIADFNQALTLKPDDTSLWIAKGEAQLQTGNHQQALEDYNHALQIDSNCALAYEKKAQVYLNLEEIQNAIIDYQKASNLYFEQENWQKYYKILDSLSKLSSKTPQFKNQNVKMKTLRDRLYILVGGYWEVAERLIDNAKMNYPNMPESWYLEKVISDLERDKGYF